MGLFGKDEMPPAKVAAEAANAMPLHIPQGRVLIRVDLLRIAARADLQASDIVERAQAFEAYVFGDQAADKP